MFVYFLETGLLLLVVPWSVFWERNLFVGQFPLLRDALLNPFVRGGISGIGLVCLAAAGSEVLTLWRRRAVVTQQHATAVPDGESSG
jgi:hypothetical protein